MSEKNDLRSASKPRKHLGRRAARLAAVQAIYQWEKVSGSIEDLVTEFIRYRLSQGPDPEHDVWVDQDHFRSVVVKTLESLEQIDPLLQKVLPEGWPFKRLDAVLRSILRAGCGEFLLNPKVAAAIVIDEYVHIAKDFFDGKEPGFVNGILDRIARELDLTMRDHIKAREAPAHEVENFLKSCETTECITWEDEGGGTGNS